MSSAPAFVTQSDTHVRVTSKDSRGNNSQAQIQRATKIVSNSAAKATNSMINKIEDSYYRNKAESNLLIVAATIMIAVIAKFGTLLSY